MVPTIAEVITWLIVGVLAGWLAGLLVKRQKAGFGRLANLGIGLIGALIGGSLLKIFHVRIELLRNIEVNLQDVVAGLLGSLIFLVVLWSVQKYRGK
jgi:uncharacterized membrane protein YeaQ/YmgE (transglycosylase-associated protein family)